MVSPSPARSAFMFSISNGVLASQPTTLLRAPRSAREAAALARMGTAAAPKTIPSRPLAASPRGIVKNPITRITPAAPAAKVTSDNTPHRDTDAFITRVNRVATLSSARASSIGRLAFDPSSRGFAALLDCRLGGRLRQCDAGHLAV